MAEINIDVTIEQPVTQVEVTVEDTAPRVEVTVEDRAPQVEVVVASSGTISNALLVANRLGEFVTEQAKMEARQNIGLQNIDLGTFY
jgi:hypothetical protein